MPLPFEKMNTPLVFLIVLPSTLVTIPIRPGRHTLSIHIVIFPLAIIANTLSGSQHTVPVFCIGHPITIVTVAIFYRNTMTLALTLHPFSLIGSAGHRTVKPVSLPIAIADLPLITIAIVVNDDAMPSGFAIHHIALIISRTRHGNGALLGGTCCGGSNHAGRRTYASRLLHFSVTSIYTEGNQHIRPIIDMDEEKTMRRFYFSWLTILIVAYVAGILTFYHQRGNQGEQRRNNPHN